MKKMSKLLSVIMALAMVMSLTVGVNAAGASTNAIPNQFTITVPSTDSHTYEVYQIFTGEFYDGKLSKIKWGENGTGTEGDAVSTAILDSLTGISSTASDQDKLDEITKYADLTGTPFTTVSKAAAVTVPGGYYLVKDADGSLDGEDDAYSLYIVQVAKNTTIARKAAKPTVDKQILDEVNDAETGAVNGWGETADHAIGESISFKLIATLTADTDYDAYPTYQVKFNDTMSNGITFDSITSVKVDGVTLGASDYSCTATANQVGGTWSLTIADIKAISGVDLTDGAVVEVIYTGHLNANASIGDNGGNKNSVNLEFSNNPNASGMGKTPDDHAWAFTYSLVNTKYKEEVKDGNELGGAKFVLYRMEGTTKMYVTLDSNKRVTGWVDDLTNATELVSDAAGDFSVYGLDTGTYYLTETEAPFGYNKYEGDIKVVISADHEEAGDGQSASTDITLTQDDTAADGIDVINNSGATLPSTGGIGTTIFTVSGIVLMLGAVILLVSKKRSTIA